MRNRKQCKIFFSLVRFALDLAWCIMHFPPHRATPAHWERPVQITPTPIAAKSEFEAQLAIGRAGFDAAGHRNDGSPWRPSNREHYARAFAQIATALPVKKER